MLYEDTLIESSIIDNDALDKMIEEDEALSERILNELNRDVYSDLFRPEFLLEDAKYSKENKYPIFIVLMHSGTSVANLIQKVTKDEFSHACIAFNKELDPLYSFGRKKLELDFRDIGFVANSPNDEFFKKFKARFGVYVMYVDKKTYKKVQDKLKFFIENKDEFRYDSIGLLMNYLKISREPEFKYFCSRFVAEIINAGNKLAKNPSLYRPNELKDLDNVELVNSGEDFSEYNVKETIINLKKIQDRYKRGDK